MVSPVVAAAACLTLANCGESDPADPPTPTSPALSAEAQAQQIHSSKQQELSRRLLALDFFSDLMWPDHDGDAGIDWLKNTAAASNLNVTRVMPEPVDKSAGVAIRPVTLQAEGDWGDVVEWLTTIEASQRRLVLRAVELHTLRNRVATDLRIAVLVDRPTGIEALSKLDVASLEGEALDHAIELIENELRGKSEALTVLGANASWSRPIAELNALLPERARPMNLSIARNHPAQRADRFTGVFTFLLSDADQTPPLIEAIRARKGFAEASLESMQPAGAGWQRVALNFTFDGQSLESDRPERAGLVEIRE